MIATPVKVTLHSSPQASNLVIKGVYDEEFVEKVGFVEMGN
jgi:hypothetical protein